MFPFVSPESTNLARPYEVMCNHLNSVLNTFSRPDAELTNRIKISIFHLYMVLSIRR